MEKAQARRERVLSVVSADDRAQASAAWVEERLAEARTRMDLPALARGDSVLMRDTRLSNIFTCQPQQKNSATPALCVPHASLASCILPGLARRVLSHRRVSTTYMCDMLLTATPHVPSSAWPRVWRLPQQVKHWHTPALWVLEVVP